MPQIAQIAETYASQIFWMLLTFGFVFFVIGQGMVPKVQATADARDAKITGDLDAAKAAFARADEAEADYRTRKAGLRPRRRWRVRKRKLPRLPKDSLLPPTLKSPRGSVLLKPASRRPARQRWQRLKPSPPKRRATWSLVFPA